LKFEKWSGRKNPRRLHPTKLQVLRPRGAWPGMHHFMSQKSQGPISAKAAAGAPAVNPTPRHLQLSSVAVQPSPKCSFSSASSQASATSTPSIRMPNSIIQPWICSHLLPPGPLFDYNAVASSVAEEPPVSSTYPLQMCILISELGTFFPFENMSGP
jgi:hypothetical protein